MADQEILSDFMEFEDSVSLTQALNTRSYDIHELIIRSVFVLFMLVNSSVKCIITVFTDTKESSLLARWEFRPMTPHRLK